MARRAAEAMQRCNQQASASTAPDAATHLLGLALGQLALQLAHHVPQLLLRQLSRQLQLPPFLLRLRLAARPLAAAGAPLPLAGGGLLRAAGALRARLAVCCCGGGLQPSAGRIFVHKLPQQRLVDVRSEQGILQRPAHAGPRAPARGGSKAAAA